MSRLRGGAPKRRRQAARSAHSKGSSDGVPPAAAAEGVGPTDASDGALTLQSTDVTQFVPRDPDHYAPLQERLPALPVHALLCSCYKRRAGGCGRGGDRGAAEEDPGRQHAGTAQQARKGSRVR